MKIYAIYIIDNEGFGGEMKAQAANRTEALKKARAYIRAWKLNPAKIEYCREIEQEA